MISRTIRVMIGEELLPVGSLDFTRDRNRQFASFAYSSDWSISGSGFDLAPDMPRETARFFTSGNRENMTSSLPMPLMDAAPDSWGRRILRRVYGDGLSELDFLLLPEDSTRMGALRFIYESGIVASKIQSSIPRRADLNKMTEVAHRFKNDPATAGDEAKILASAGASVGGARPKVNVLDAGGSLWLGKLTEKDENLPTERVEVATSRLARSAGLKTPESALELGGTDFPVALFRRFDRTADGCRLHYISSRTALNRQGTDPGYYSEIADFLQNFSVDPEADLRELWSRMVFTILVRNTDDHLKNHGMVYARNGKWRLSPMFDVNPQPTRVPGLETGISPEHGFAPSIAAAIDAAPLFLIEEAEASESACRIARNIVDHWRAELSAQGVTGASLRAYEAAFEHEETEAALSAGCGTPRP